MQDRFDRALSLARQAVNAWACYAKRDVEHAEIARLHQAISELGAEADPAGAQQTLEK